MTYLLGDMAYLHGVRLMFYTFLLQWSRVILSKNVNISRGSSQINSQKSLGLSATCLYQLYKLELVVRQLSF